MFCEMACRKFSLVKFRTMDAAIRAHVRSPHLRQLLGRFATYVGGNPYEAPATLNVIAHVELNGGVWYPNGGIYAIARALEKLAREMGVIIHTGWWKLWAQDNDRYVKTCPGIGVKAA